MTCHLRHFCPDCDEELIHRDHRHGNESSSALGQIVHRMKRTFTYGDIDGYTLKRSRRMLRFVEHKQPDQPAKSAQSEVLAVLDTVIGDYVDRHPGNLHPESGVYIMRGAIEPATAGRRETRLAGPQRITNNRVGEIIVNNELELFRWLDCEGA